MGSIHTIQQNQNCDIFIFIIYKYGEQSIQTPVESWSKVII